MSDKKKDYRKEKSFSLDYDSFESSMDYEKKDRQKHSSIPSSTTSGIPSGNSQAGHPRVPFHSGDKTFVKSIQVEVIINNEMVELKFMPFPDRKPADEKQIRILLHDGSVITHCARRPVNVSGAYRRDFFTSVESNYSENHKGSQDKVFFTDSEVKGWWYSS